MNQEPNSSAAGGEEVLTATAGGDQPRRETRTRQGSDGTNGSGRAASFKDRAAGGLGAAKEILAGVDWRGQVSERPVALSAGALGVGLFVGYCVAGAVKSGGRKTSNLHNDDARTTKSAGESGTSKLYHKFKGTPAFDRLRREAGRIGNKIADEFSDIGNNVLLPALTAKVKSAVSNKSASTAAVGRVGRPERGRN